MGGRVNVGEGRAGEWWGGGWDSLAAWRASKPPSPTCRTHEPSLHQCKVRGTL